MGVDINQATAVEAGLARTGLPGGVQPGSLRYRAGKASHKASSHGPAGGTIFCGEGVSERPRADCDPARTSGLCNLLVLYPRPSLRSGPVVERDPRCRALSRIRWSGAPLGRPSRRVGDADHDYWPGNHDRAGELAGVRSGRGGAADFRAAWQWKCLGAGAESGDQAMAAGWRDAVRSLAARIDQPGGGARKVFYLRKAGRDDRSVD